MPVFPLCAALLLFQDPPAAPAAELARFESVHGPGWRIDLDEGTGFVEFLGGGATALSFRPRGEPEWFVLAREALAASAALHGIEPATLCEEHALLLPLGLAGTSDKWSVRFRQEVGGVPVEGGAVNVLFDSAGRLLSVQTRALPAIAGLDVRPSFDARRAGELALAAFAGESSATAQLLSDPELQIAQLERGERREGVLAWRVEAGNLAPDSAPEAWAYLFDARSGALLRRDTLIHHFDVSGTLRTRATPGTAPDQGTNPAVEVPLGYTRVSSGAAIATSDAQGNFTLVGVDAPLTLSAGYDGTFNNVINQSGADYLLNAQVAAAVGNVLVLNPQPTEHVTAQANVAVEINRMRDWVRAVNPLDSKADFVHTAYVNINSACNAYFNGSAINFFIAASGCVNTAYSTVIAHEDGHWLNNRYGTGNGGDGMGEGNADVFAMFLYDDPIVGLHFCGNNCNIRSGDNLRPFCGDCCGGCYGEVHADGEVWMGVAWKIRRNLDLLLGNAAGDAAADALFLGWMNAYNQGQIKTVIELQWLVLDDDDGDLGNGTPHFAQIDTAFRQQGFPGVTLQPLYLSGVTQLADTLDSQGPYVVDAMVQSNSVSAVNAVELFYRTHAGSFASVPMTSQGGNAWRGEIPGQPAPSKVYYYVRAQNGAGQSGTWPPSGALQPLFFSVGSNTTVFRDSFEFAQGWSVVNTTLASGGWVRGEPLGTFAGLRQAQPDTDDPADPGEFCFFTAQGSSASAPDEADVDGGPTELSSPVLSLTGEVAELAYSYWVFSLAGDDTLVVELSPDGVQWTPVRTHSSGDAWRRERVDVSTHITPGVATRVRFRIADSPNNTITEAAIDDVEWRVLGLGACPAPQVFCAAKINSEFCLPSIGSSGSASASSGLPFLIGAARVLNNKSGLLFYGYGTNGAPFKGGLLCCATPLLRTPTQVSGGSASGSDCSGSLLFDMNAWIVSGVDPNLVPGASVAAQFYYRDPQDAFTLGLTDALSFVICP